MKSEAMEKSAKASHMVNLKAKWEDQKYFFDAGVIAALYDALKLANDSGYPPPDWAVEGALLVIADRLKHGHTVGKGITGNELTKYQKAMKRFRQWQKVEHLRAKGLTKDKAIEQAVEELKETFAKATFNTIEKNHKRVQKELKDPLKANQYYGAYTEVQSLTNTPTV